MDFRPLSGSPAASSSCGTSRLSSCAFALSLTCLVPGLGLGDDLRSLRFCKGQNQDLCVCAAAPFFRWTHRIKVESSVFTPFPPSIDGRAFTFVNDGEGDELPLFPRTDSQSRIVTKPGINDFMYKYTPFSLGLSIWSPGGQFSLRSELTLK